MHLYLLEETDYTLNRSFSTQRNPRNSLEFWTTTKKFLLENIIGPKYIRRQFLKINQSIIHKKKKVSDREPEKLCASIFICLAVDNMIYISSYTAVPGSMGPNLLW